MLPGVPAPQNRSITTRARLIDTARRLFAARGYDATSIQDVIDESGVSRGALYHHFENKAHLFEVVFEQLEGEIAAQLLAGLRDAGSPRDALAAGAGAFLALANDPAVRQIVLVDAPNALGWAKWREIDGRHGFGLLRAAVQAEADSGRIPPELVDSYAHVLLAAHLELALMVAQAEDPEAAIAPAQRTIDELIARIFSA
jgi:AcrR family transcriptional regulator